MNEKLNIQPITPNRMKILHACIVERLGWKDRLKSGDVIVMEHHRESIMLGLPNEYIFLSYEDLDKYHYKDLLEITSVAFTKDAKEGVLVHRTDDRYTYTCLSRYMDDKMENKWGDKIVEIARCFDIKMPIDEKFFLDIKSLKSKSVIIYKRNDNVSEKLNIQPISKERLAKTVSDVNDIRTHLKCGDIARCETFGDTEYAVFITHDFAEKQSSIYPFDLIHQKLKMEKSSGGFVYVVSGDVFAMNVIETYNKSLVANNGKGAQIEALLRLNEFDPNDFVMVEYVKAPPIDYGKIYWTPEEGLNISVLEKLDIQPMSKEQLKKTASDVNDVRTHIKCGDIAQCNESGHYHYRVYVTREYLKKQKHLEYPFGSMLKSMEENNLNGCFVRPFGDNTYIWRYIEDIDDKLVSKASNPLYVSALLRIKDFNQNSKISIEYIHRPPVSFAECYWTAEHGFDTRPMKMNEKLNIQPISKERLKNTFPMVKYKTPWDMRANFKTGDIAIIGNQKGHIATVFISAEDVASGKYDKLFNFFLPMSHYKESEEGAFVFLEKANYFTRDFLSEYNSSLQMNLNTKVLRVYRIAAEPHIDINFFENINYIAKKTNLIWDEAWR